MNSSPPRTAGPGKTFTRGLYDGPDLHEAARNSRIDRTLSDRVGGIRNAAAIGLDTVVSRLRRPARPALELVLARGEAPDGSGELTSAYLGTGANREWCFSTAFGTHVETGRIPLAAPGELQRTIEDVREQVDVVFAEEFAAGCRAGFVPLPAWVKQRVRVLEDWPALIDGLRRETRQEIGRYLRKYQYGCRLSRSREDFEHFYDRLYKRYVPRRFGSTAQLVERRTFLRECARGVLLQVTRDKDVLGAALLRPVGRTMAVVWSALDPDRDAGRLRGVTDTLDYFGLLYAHLRHCRWLDLGPSRPDLLDGTLRYKGKWGAQIYPGVTPQPTLFIACKAATDAQRSFLKRHAWLLRTPAGLRGTLFVDGDADPEALASGLSRLLQGGVREYQVVALTTPAPGLREAAGKVRADVTVVDGSRWADVLGETGNFERR